jgi:hypothetical protein
MRGKSTLVNALLRTPGLSPVGVEATTSAPISFYHASAPNAAVFRYGSEQAEVAEVDRARSLATVAGNRGNEENVRAVSIGMDLPLLNDLVLVDTPGVGGLDSGHGALTLQSLNHADALVFVAEAGAQFRAAELRFLQRASARIDTVIIALTKVDLYRGWRTILEDDAAILREQAPRFADCPMVPVSSKLALRALTLEDEEESAALRAESGLTRLEEVLQANVLDRESALRRANLLRAAFTFLDSTGRVLRQRLAAQGNGTGRHALEAEQARLRELAQQRARWPQTIDVEIRKLTLERQEITGRRTLEIRRSYEERLKKIQKKEYDTLPGELIADLTALASELNETTATRLEQLVKTVLSEIDEASLLEGEIDQVTTQPLAEELTAMSLDHHKMTGSDKMGIFTSFVTGRALGSLMSGSGLGVAGAAIVAWPVALALGFSVGGFFAFEAFRNRNRQAFTSQFTTWMRDQITKTQLTLNAEFNRGLIELQTHIKSAIQTALVDREREINQALAQARALAKTQASSRQRLARRLTQQEAIARKLREEGQTWLPATRQLQAVEQGGNAA